MMDVCSKSDELNKDGYKWKLSALNALQAGTEDHLMFLVSLLSLSSP
jgi:hypothetical protein